MDVSVIMVNYNTREMTAAAIDSVFEKTTGVDFEVILVDNASNDGSREQFANDSRIKYFYLDENIGFGQANNYGVKNGASGKYLFFLNTDTLLINNALKVLYTYLETHSNVGAAGGNLYAPDNKPATSFEKKFQGIGFTLDKLASPLFRRATSDMEGYFNYSDKPLSVAYISGADLMMPHKLFLETGGFDKQFFMYFEETDLCFRIKKSGYKIMSIPEAKIVHFEGGSQKKNPDSLIRKVKMSAKSRSIFINNNHSRLYAKIDKLLYCSYLRLLKLRSNEKDVIDAQLKNL